MTTVNILENGTDFSKLVKMLENKEEDVIYIARNGVNIARLTLIPKGENTQRIGIAAGKLNLPDDFDDEFDGLDSEMASVFENGGAL